MVIKKILFWFVFVIVMAACSTADPSPTEAPAPGGMGMMNRGGGMNMGGGMMERHHAPIPEAYVGLVNPVPMDEASIERGGAVYTAQCASCHGDGGMGDGPAGVGLDPAPVPIARTSQQMSDAYLFWRITEGGAVFNTAMPGWSGLDEQTRWDLINYMRALGKGIVQPGRGPGGAAFDPQAGADHQAAMLAEAVAQGVISEDEAEIFDVVHTALEQYREANRGTLEGGGGGAAGGQEAAMLAALVAEGTITQAQADAFQDIHDRIAASGLMP